MKRATKTPINTQAYTIFKIVVLMMLVVLVACYVIGQEPNGLYILLSLLGVLGTAYLIIIALINGKFPRPLHNGHVGPSTPAPAMPITSKPQSSVPLKKSVKPKTIVNYTQGDTVTLILYPAGSKDNTLRRIEGMVEEFVEGDNVSIKLDGRTGQCVTPVDWWIK